jgi:hypothetical protein
MEVNKFACLLEKPETLTPLFACNKALPCWRTQSQFRPLLSSNVLKKVQASELFFGFPSVMMVSNVARLVKTQEVRWSDSQ